MPLKKRDQLVSFVGKFNLVDGKLRDLYGIARECVCAFKTSMQIDLSET